MKAVPDQTPLHPGKMTVSDKPVTARFPRSHDRPAFRSRTILPSPASTYSTPKHPINNRNIATKPSSFVSPFKSRAPELSPIPEARTPVPEGTACAKGRGFATPYKQPPPSSSFTTPVRNDGTNSSFLWTTEEETIKESGALQSESARTEPTKDMDAQQMELTEDPEINVAEPSRAPQVTGEVARKRLHAKVAQAQKIRAKRERGDTKPLPGSLWRHKQGGQRVTLKEAVQGQLPKVSSKQEVRKLVEMC